jgi:hypothetical protein
MLKIKIKPGMFNKNSCPLQLEVFDIDGNSCGFASYLKRVGDHVYYQHNGKTYMLQVRSVTSAKSKVGIVVV